MSDIGTPETTSFETGPNICQTRIGPDLLKTLSESPDSVALLIALFRTQVRDIASTVMPEGEQAESIAGLDPEVAEMLNAIAYLKQGECPTIFLQSQGSQGVDATLVPNGEMLRINPDDSDGTVILFDGLLGIRTVQNENGEYSDLQIMPRLLKIKSLGEGETEAVMKVDRTPEGHVKVGVYVSKGEVEITDFNGNLIAIESEGHAVEISENMIQQGNPGETDYSVSVSYQLDARFEVSKNEEGALVKREISIHEETEAPSDPDIIDSSDVSDVSSPEVVDAGTADFESDAISPDNSSPDAFYPSADLKPDQGGVQAQYVSVPPSGGCAAVDMFSASQVPIYGPSALLPLVLIAALRTVQRGIGIKKQIRSRVEAPDETIAIGKRMGEEMIGSDIDRIRGELDDLAKSDPVQADILGGLLDAVEEGRNYQGEDAMRVRKSTIHIYRAVRQAGKSLRAKRQTKKSAVFGRPPKEIQLNGPDTNRGSKRRTPHFHEERYPR